MPHVQTQFEPCVWKCRGYPKFTSVHNPPPQTFNRGLQKKEEKKKSARTKTYNEVCGGGAKTESFSGWLPFGIVLTSHWFTSVRFLFFLVSKVQANQTIITCRLKRGGKNREAAAGKTTKKNNAAWACSNTEKSLFLWNQGQCFRSMFLLHCE